ncbi:MAG: ParB/RepB/Spo0J family partition protein [Patescibacteria group bacterium]
MNKTSGLGRGLDSLIPQKSKSLQADEPTSQSGDKEKISEIPVENIFPNPNQPRQNFDQASLDELADSIKEHGIIQPLILVRMNDREFQIVAGERRWRAAKSAGLKTVPAVVRDVNEQKKLELALIENIQRKNLNPLEAALAYRKLMEEFNLNQGELAKRLGKDQSAISNTMRILNTIPQVKEAVMADRISEGHARVLAGLPEEDQINVLNQILAEKWNVRQTEKAGRGIVMKKQLRKIPSDPEARAKEEELQDYFGTKVDVRKIGGAGQIVIKFFSNEEYQDILKKLMK